MKNWYKTWFDSEFYHLLYQHRDCNEAALFINQLVEKLTIKKGSKVLDFACGRGRHAICLHKKGLNVTGIDLSKKSIAFAKKYETKDLRFVIHDMRMPFCSNEYDYVFSFFTSFGYFDLEKDDLMVIESVSRSLKPGGIFVLDFLNAERIKNNEQDFYESKKSGGILFNISRKIEKNSVVKTIAFTCKKIDYCFKERVRLYKLEDFEKMFSNNMKIVNVYGDYHFKDYNLISSDRLIVVAQKKQSR